MSESQVSVTRWKRFGHDRLYVRDAQEQTLGWWDLTTEEAHPAEDQLLAVVTDAVTAWKAEHGVASVATAKSLEVTAEESVPVSEVVTPAPVETAIEPAASSSVPQRPWLDLATNAPGAGVREMATSAQLAAPVRSVFARVLGVHTDERAWRIGADGEEKVAVKLARVAKRDSRWRFLHSIPVGTRGSDIDHLAIGPGGVFTINSKHHPKAKIWVGGNTFLVDGHKQTYVRNSRFEAARAAELLTAVVGFAVTVEGLIVTVNAADVVVKSQPTGVHVVPRMQVAQWLLRLGDILDQERIDAVYDAARRSTTWRP